MYLLITCINLCNQKYIEGEELLYDHKGFPYAIPLQKLRPLISPP